MSIFIRFEPDPASEMDQEQEPLLSLDGSVFEPLSLEHGVFTFALTDIRQVLECAFSQLQPHFEYQWVQEQAWQKRWEISPAEYYPPILELLAQVEATAGTFDWQSFEPVYSAASLASGALEIELGEARCKVCNHNFRAAELDVFQWSRSGSFHGSEYVCPTGHVLLRTRMWMMGEAGAPYRRSKRERRSALCMPLPLM